MPKPLKCKCTGTIQLENPFHVQVSCMRFTPAYPCDKCGKLHWDDGSPIKNRSGNNSFLIDGNMILKDKKGKIVATAT